MTKQKRPLPLFSLFIAASLILFCAVAAILTAKSDKDGDQAPSHTPTGRVGTTATPTAQALTHVVQPGETLGLIAKQYGLTLETLIALNDVADPDKIEVGQELVVSVPPDWTPPPTAAP